MFIIGLLVYIKGYYIIKKMDNISSQKEPEKKVKKVCIIFKENRPGNSFLNK